MGIENTGTAQPPLATYNVFLAGDAYFHGVRARSAALARAGGDKKRIRHCFMCRGREKARATAREKAEALARATGKRVIDADI